MSHNKSLRMQKAIQDLDRALAVEAITPSSLPGAALKHIKEARKILLRDIRKRHNARDREVTKQEKPHFPGYSTLPFK